MPNTTYSSSVSVTEITGVAARTVGVYIGCTFIVLAFLPKFMALILAIPGPVVGAYTIVLMAALFVLGMRVVVEDGADYRKGIVAGVAFWIGLGFQNELIFADALGAWSGLLGNGMTSGGLAAILMTAFLELARPRRQQLRTALNAAAYPAMDKFLTRFAGSQGWSDAMTDRLRAVGEETLLTLTQRDEDGAAEERRLLLAARRDGRAAAAGVRRGDRRHEHRGPHGADGRPRGRQPGWSRTSRYGCCGTWPRPCATSSITTRTS